MKGKEKIEVIEEAIKNAFKTSHEHLTTSDMREIEELVSALERLGYLLDNNE